MTSVSAYPAQRANYLLATPDIGTVGPWDGEVGYTNALRLMDALENKIWAQTPMEVVQPDPQSTEAAAGLLATVPNVRFTYFGQPHHFDMFIGTDELRFTQDVSIAQYTYEVQLERLQAAQGSGHAGSAHALNALHHIAQAGGKIAFVHAHGGATEGVLRLFSGKQSRPADEIIRDLAARRGPSGELSYAAIFLSACNRRAIAPNMDGVAIPIIAQMGVNGISAEGNARVFFPEAAAPLDKEATAGLLRRIALSAGRLLRFDRTY